MFPTLRKERRRGCSARLFSYGALIALTEARPIPPNAMKIKIVNLPSSSSEEDKRLLESFVQFNKEWITRYFRLEASDLHYLARPKEYILDKGGHVFVALADGKPIGCCALIPHPESGRWELAKMAVTAAGFLGRAVGRPVVVGEVEVGDAVVEGVVEHLAALAQRARRAEALPQPERHAGEQHAALAATFVHCASAP